MSTHEPVAKLVTEHGGRRAPLRQSVGRGPGIGRARAAGRAGVAAVAGACAGVAGLLLACLASLALAGPAAASEAVEDIPAHPGELTFPELRFEPPAAEQYRHELPGGVPVYLAPSHEWPLVDITFTFRGGDYLEAPDEVGLASAVGVMLRRGGTASLSPEELDERLDFLAADVSTSVGSERATASINCLKSNFAEAFELFTEMLVAPGFDAARLRVHKDELLESFKQRNDNPMSVAFPRMARLLYGDRHYLAREATAASVEAITPEALRAMHARIFHPGNLIISATGDFEVEPMLAALEEALAGWTAGERAPDPPAPTHEPVAALYHAGTTQADLPQGTTLLFGPGVRRDDPDAIALQVMNDILGGGGFTSRVTNRVRSDEGLAYTAVTFMRPRVYFPGSFAGFFQSKNATVALATKLILEEIERIRTEPVTDEELARTKNGFIEQFPQRFASKETMLSTFVDDELTGRDPDYWRTYRDRVAAVTADEVQRVAREHVDPAGLSVLVVGDWTAIEGGDLDGRASMDEFFGGEVIHLPMLDPLTREPMEETVPAAP